MIDDDKADVGPTATQPIVPGQGVQDAWRNTEDLHAQMSALVGTLDKSQTQQRIRVCCDKDVRIGEGEGR